VQSKNDIFISFLQNAVQNRVFLFFIGCLGLPFFDAFDVFFAL